MSGETTKHDTPQEMAVGQLQLSEQAQRDFKQFLHSITDNTITVTDTAQGPLMVDGQGNRVTNRGGAQPMTIECANGRSEPSGFFFPEWFAAQTTFHGHGPGIEAKVRETDTGREMQLGIIESPLAGRCNVLQSEFEDLGAPLHGVGQPPAKGGRGGP